MIILLTTGTAKHPMYHRINNSPHPDRCAETSLLVFGTFQVASHSNKIGGFVVIKTSKYLLICQRIYIRHHKSKKYSANHNQVGLFFFAKVCVTVLNNKFITVHCGSYRRMIYAFSHFLLTLHSEWNTTIYISSNSRARCWRSLVAPSTHPQTTMPCR